MSRPLLLVWVAVAAAIVGVFLTWTADGTTALDGVQGPHDGWLVLIVSAFALGWARPLARGSRIGAVGVAGCAIVIAWTVVGSWLDGRAVTEASAGVGALVVGVASVLLVAAVVTSVAGMARRRSGT